MYSSLIKVSNVFEKLFKTIGKVFLGLTLIYFFLISVLIEHYYFKVFPNETTKSIVAYIYFASPSIITLVLSIASFVVARCAYNIRLELPADDKK